MTQSRIIKKHLNQPAPTPDSPRAKDSTAPTAPGTPVVSTLTADSATLTFAASTDAVGVVGYAAFFDGGETPWAYSVGNATSITLTGLKPGSHSVTVKAFDAVWNWSAASAAVGFVIAAQAVDASVVKVASIADLPAPNGVPMVAQVYKSMLTSDGAVWKDESGNYIFDKLPGFALIGDSTMALGNSSGTVSAISATIGDTAATLTRTSHGLNKGARFVMQGADQSEFNGVFEVVSVVSANQITYTMASPATVTAATGTMALTSQQIVKDSAQVNLANQISGAPALYVGNFAQGGSKTAHLNRQIDLLLNKANNLWNRDVDIVFISTGVNDAFNDIPLATTQANVLAAIDRLHAAKKMIVLFAQMPVSNTYANWTLARLQLSRQYNAWLRQLAKTDQRFVLFDANAVGFDAANQYGNWKANYSADGIHPSKPAGFAMAVALANQFFSKIRSVDDRVLTPLLTNSAMSGITGTKTGTGISGDVADTFTLNAAGGGAQAVVGSKGAALSGNTESQRAVVTAAAALDAGEFFIDYHASGVADAWYVAKAKIRTTSISNIRDLNLFINTIIDGTSVGYGVMSAYENFEIGDSEQEFTLETPPLKFPASGVTRFRPYIRARALAAGAVTVDISEFNLYRI